MKDIKYKAYSFRISEEVKLELENRRKEKKLSWNMLFKELLDIKPKFKLTQKKL